MSFAHNSISIHTKQQSSKLEQEINQNQQSNKQELKQKKQSAFLSDKNNNQYSIDQTELNKFNQQQNQAEKQRITIERKTSQNSTNKSNYPMIVLNHNEQYDNKVIIKIDGQEDAKNIKNQNQNVLPDKVNLFEQNKPYSKASEKSVMSPKKEKENQQKPSQTLKIPDHMTKSKRRKRSHLQEVNKSPQTKLTPPGHNELLQNANKKTEILFIPNFSDVIKINQQQQQEYFDEVQQEERQYQIMKMEQQKERQRQQQTRTQRLRKQSIQKPKQKINSPMNKIQENTPTFFQPNLENRRQRINSIQAFQSQTQAQTPKSKFQTMEIEKVEKQQVKPQQCLSCKCCVM